MSTIVKRRRVSGDAIAKPQLTSLLDVMTILLVFLIQNFSSQGNLMSVPKDIDLAKSASKSQANKSLTIEVGIQHIALDGARMNLDVLKKKTTDNTIPELFARLEFLQGQGDPSLNTASVLIQCDKGVDFAVLKRVLATCSKAGVQNYSLLVKGES